MGDQHQGLDNGRGLILDIGVVGAGIAGLAAASGKHTLRQVIVVVSEAKTRSKFSVD